MEFLGHTPRINPKPKPPARPSSWRKNGGDNPFVAMSDSTHEKDSEKLSFADERSMPWFADRLIRNLSAKFAGLEGPKIEKGIVDALKIFGEFIAAEHAFLCFLGEENRKIAHIYEWCKPGIAPGRSSWEGNSPDSLPWKTNIFQKLKKLSIDSDVNREGRHSRNRFESSRSFIFVLRISKELGLGVDFRGLGGGAT